MLSAIATLDGYMTDVTLKASGPLLRSTTGTRGDLFDADTSHKQQETFLQKAGPLLVNDEQYLV
jgi:hypothetical protein